MQAGLADFLAENRVGRAQRGKPLRRHLAQNPRGQSHQREGLAQQELVVQPQHSGDFFHLVAEEQRQRFEHRHAAILPRRVVRAAQKIAVIRAHHQRLRAGDGLRLPDHLFMQAGNDHRALFAHRLPAAKGGQHVLRAVDHAQRNPELLVNRPYSCAITRAHQPRFNVNRRHPLAERLMRQHRSHHGIHAAAHAANRESAFNRGLRQRAPRFGQRRIHREPRRAAADVARKVFEDGRAVRVVALQLKLNAEKRPFAVLKGDGAAARARRHLHVGRQHQRHGLLNVAFAALHAVKQLAVRVLNIRFFLADGRACTRAAHRRNQHVRGVPQRQHGDIQLQNLRVEHARRALRFAAEHEPARRDFRNLRRRRRAADDFTENPLAAKPFRRLDGKLIRVIENEDHVVHASFPPTGRALICPIPKEAAPRLGETASSVTKGIRSARE